MSSSEESPATPVFDRNHLEHVRVGVMPGVAASPGAYASSCLEARTEQSLIEIGNPARAVGTVAR